MSRISYWFTFPSASFGLGGPAVAFAARENGVLAEQEEEAL
jgi:hypothetical protein